MHDILEWAKPSPFTASDDNTVEEVITSTTEGVFFKASEISFSNCSGFSTLLLKLLGPLSFWRN